MGTRFIITGGGRDLRGRDGGPTRERGVGVVTESGTAEVPGDRGGGVG